MAFKKHKQEPKIVVKKVPSDKSKIKFVAVFEGEIDWNELFGMDKDSEYSLCHECSDFRYGGDSFSQSFINFIFSVASRCDDYKVFQKAKLTNLDINKEVESVYKEFKDEINSRERAKKLDKLKEAEKEVARLRGEVLGEFKNG